MTAVTGLAAHRQLAAAQAGLAAMQRANLELCAGLAAMRDELAAARAVAAGLAAGQDRPALRVIHGGAA